MTKTEHIHKFKRLIYKSGNSIFFCATPDCKQKISIPLALGKRSICWRCGEPFVMNEYSLRLAKPHCGACHKAKKNDSLESLISNIPQEVETLSLADRLNQTIQSAKQEMEDEL